MKRNYFRSVTIFHSKSQILITERRRQWHETHFWGRKHITDKNSESFCCD